MYRVAQRITPDLVSEEGPVLPTEDWAEKELRKSLSGWIEVYQGCLVSTAFLILYRLSHSSTPVHRA